MSTRTFFLALLMSIWLRTDSLYAVTTHRCPTQCRINGMQRNTLNRLNRECLSTAKFVKCSTSLWLTADGSLNVTFDGDSSEQAINESLTSHLSDQFFYHHTQMTFYANVSEVTVYVRYSCFDEDDCSRTFAQKMVDRLLDYKFIELDRQIRPLMYDPLVKSEIYFSTPNLTCLIDNKSTIASCDTSCYYSSWMSHEQHECWPNAIMGLHVYTQYDLPAPINSTISMDYNCNTRGSICNGPDIVDNITRIVDDFFYNPPYLHLGNSCGKSQLVSWLFIMMVLCVIYKSCADTPA